MKLDNIILVSTMIVWFILLYIYYPYYYVVAYSFFLIYLGILLLTEYTHRTNIEYDTRLFGAYVYGAHIPAVWYIYIMVCNVILTNYVPYNIKTVITIWVTSLGVYILATYFIKQILHYINIPTNSLSNHAFHKLYLALMSFITIMYLGIGYVLIHYGLYGIWAINTVLIAIIEYIAIPHTSRSAYNFIRLLAPLLLCIYILYYIYKAYQSRYMGILFKNDPLLIGPYKKILTKLQFNELRVNAYKYSIQFDLRIIPQYETIMDASMIKIDDTIDVRYNSITSVLSIYVLPSGQTEYTLIYGGNYSPSQVWTTYIFNIIDGRLDLFIGNSLKFTQKVILGDNRTDIGLTIGDKNNRPNKGYIRSIIIRDNIYVPPPLM